VVWYLWLVMPWVAKLEAGLAGDQEYRPSMHLWPLQPAGPLGRRWSSERAGRALRREFRAAVGQDVGISAYRHLAIAISRKFLREPAAFAADEDDEEGGLDEEREMDAIMDEQAGHGSHVAGMVYARGLMEQDGAVASKRELFRRSSLEWHCFLGFASAVGQQPRAKRAREEEEEAADQGLEQWKRRRTVDLSLALVRMYGRGAVFRPMQEEALRAIMAGESLVVAVMATGSGKSLLFMLPAACSPGGLTVVVVPLVSLRQDLGHRCASIGLVCAEWQPGGQRPPDAASVVLVTPESAVSGEFSLFLNRVRATRRLERVVVDESHLMLDDGSMFRPAMRQLHRLTRLKTQLVLLTATLPVEREAELWEPFGFRGDEVRMFRASTVRTNVRYEVVHCAGRRPSKLDLVARLVPRAAAGKTIVYCNTVREVEAVASQLGCAAYHASADGKREILTNFVKTDGAVIAATSALGLGIDIPDVRMVVHVGQPRTLLEFAQESGRAGRDGRLSRAVVVVDDDEEYRWQSHMEDGWGDPPIRQFIWADECRRAVLDKHLDGRTGRQACEAGEATCDVCDDGTADLPDEYREQLQQREVVHRRIVEREVRAESDMDGLAEALRTWRGRCVVCHVLGDGQDDDHELYQCSRGVEFKRWARTTRSSMRFPEYAACFSCGLPPSMCDRWEMDPAGRKRRIPGRDCLHRSTMYGLLAGFACVGLRDLRDRWTARLQQNGVDAEDSAALYAYLAAKRGEHRNETNNLMWEFYWAARQLSAEEM